MTPINIQFKVAGLVPFNIDVFEIVISCQQRQKIVLIPGPASSMTKFFCVSSQSLDIRDATTSTPGTLNDLTTDLIMANNNNKPVNNATPE